MDPASLSLFVATPEQAEVSRRRSGSGLWGNGMTLDDYLQRDLDLEKSECGKDSKFTTWVLAPRHSPTTLHFLCACETFRRAGLIVRGTSINASPTGSKGQSVIDQVDCYGIASVFTPEENRGKGYARLMMSLLHWVLAGKVLSTDSFPEKEWGIPPIPLPGEGKAAFSALWSDVGNFYRTCSPSDATHTKRNGWVVRGTTTTKWVPKRNVTENPDSMEQGDWKWLSESEVKQLSIYDAERMRSDLNKAWSTSSPRTKVMFTFLPIGGVEAFQRERLKIFWGKESIDRWGVGLVDSRSPDLSTLKAFATWTLELRPPAPRTLVVTRLHAPQLSDFLEVLQSIWRYSLEHDIEAVEVWNLPLHLREGYVSACRWFKPFEETEEFERKEHLPAFKWYGYGSESGLGSDVDEPEIEWVYNEKFCWC